MTFDAPWMLWALPCLAIPVVAHLTRGKLVPTQRLPTVSILAKVIRRRGRARKLQDRLLLILRILLLSILIIALTQPALWVAASTRSTTPEAIAIVLDNSFSMSQRVGDETAFQAALKKADVLVRGLAVGSEIVIVTASAPPIVLLSRTRSKDFAIETLRATPQTGRSTALAGAVRLATQQLAGTQLERRTCHVFTDGNGPIEQVLEKDPVGATGLNLHPAIPGPASNVAIQEVHVHPNRAKNGELRIDGKIRAFGDAPIDKVVVRLQHPEISPMVEEVLLEEKRGTFSFTLEKRFESPGLAQLELDPKDGYPDAIGDDNRWPVELARSKNLQVLLVDGRPNANPNRSEAGYLSRALEYAPFPLEHRVISMSGLTQTAIHTSDVVILANVGRPPHRHVDQLKTFVEQGGGLLIVGGSRVGPGDYNALGNELLPAEIVGVRSNPEPLSVSRTERGTVTSAHHHGLNQARVSSHLLLGPIVAGATRELDLSNGDPLLLWKRFEEGRVALLLTSVSSEWSNLPTQAGFLPLMVRLITKLASSVASFRNDVISGTPVRLPTEPRDRLRIISPLGTHTWVGSDGAFPGTDTPGVYRVQEVQEEGARGLPDLSFIVRPSPSESDVSHIGFEDSSWTGNAPPSPTRTRKKLPIEPWLLLAFAFLLVLEGMLRSWSDTRTKLSFQR